MLGNYLFACSLFVVVLRLPMVRHRPSLKSGFTLLEVILAILIARNYVIVWGRDRSVLLRPETPATPEEAEGLQKWKIQKGETLELHLPAALTEKGITPDAIWTFWPTGICEPAEVRYKGGAGAWSAVYNPFTVQGEVSYD